MAFINEFVSEEDIVKYQLNEQHIKWKGWIPPQFRHTWTVDKERDIYYIPMRTGREDESNQTECVLYYKGIHWVVEIRSEGIGRRQLLSENPYRQVWGLVSIKHPDGENAPIDEIKVILKEVLTAFQTDGIHTYKGLNVITTFTF